MFQEFHGAYSFARVEEADELCELIAPPTRGAS
jgi:hypothetical protein